MDDSAIRPQLLLDYATLRYAGYPPGRVAKELRSPVAVAVLEQAFLGRARAKGEAAMLPKYARDESHVGAVLRCGGYPVCVKHG